MARRTEGRYLQYMQANPGGIQIGPGTDLDKLMGKLGKPQSKAGARAVTDVTEGEFAQFLGLLGEAARAAVVDAIRPYTVDSSRINAHCRGQAGAQDESAAVAQLDRMFGLARGVGADKVNRIVYRLSTYRAHQHVPYGAAPNGPFGAIAVGDLVTDPAFLSASENRRLLSKPIQNPAPGDRSVRFVICGAGGVNVAGASLYTNASEAGLVEMSRRGARSVVQKLKRHFEEADAGQAEVLFPRGTVFRVEEIRPAADGAHVRLSVPSPQPDPATAKSMFDGLSAGAPRRRLAGVSLQALWAAAKATYEHKTGGKKPALESAAGQKANGVLARVFQAEMTGLDAMLGEMDRQLAAAYQRPPGRATTAEGKRLELELTSVSMRLEKRANDYLDSLRRAIAGEPDQTKRDALTALRAALDDIKKEYNGRLKWSEDRGVRKVAAPPPGPTSAPKPPLPTAPKPPVWRPAAAGTGAT